MQNNGKKLVPMTAYVDEDTRRRVKILAAQKGKTMRFLQDEAFKAGLELLEAQYADEEEQEHQEAV